MGLEITPGSNDPFRAGDRLVTPGTNEIGGVRVESKAMEVLVALADAAPPAVLSGATLLERIWPDVVVDNVVYQAVAQLRKAFGDEAHAPRYIATIPRRGYRVIAAVARETPDARAPSIVVLPFTNVSPDPEHEHFVDGLTILRPGHRANRESGHRGHE